jgi:uncharacterized protein
MPPMIVARMTEVAEACRRFGVARLEVFGSSVAGPFDPARSDLDFLVSFTEEARQKAFDNFFGLHERLEELFGHRVDLVTERSIKNPILKRSIDAQRQVVYAA